MPRRGPGPLSRVPARPAALALVLALTVTATGCVAPAEPEPASIRQTPPPWDAPRDAISYLAAAGLEPLPLDLTSDSRTVQLTVTLDGHAVQVPAYLGVDRLRSVQAAAHTHDSSGTVWLEGKGATVVSLGQLFTLWGVRLDRRCIGAACGDVTVTTEPESPVTDPRSLVLAGVRSITVIGRS